MLAMGGFDHHRIEAFWVLAVGVEIGSIVKVHPSAPDN
jgi:hypothetical protein